MSRRLPLALCLLALSSAAQAAGERFDVAKEEPATTYTRRFNWAHPRPNFYATTDQANENPRLDQSSGPDGTLLGTATAQFNGLPPGTYELWLFYRRTSNRTRCAPWSAVADDQAANRHEGIIDQKGDDGPDGKWFLLPETRTTPIPVTGSLTVVLGRDDPQYPCHDGRSVAYGGARVVRVQDAPPQHDAGQSPDAGRPPDAGVPPDAAAVNERPADARGDAGETPPLPGVAPSGTGSADAQALPGPPPHPADVTDGSAAGDGGSAEAGHTSGGCSQSGGAPVRGAGVAALCLAAFAVFVLSATQLRRRTARSSRPSPAGACTARSDCRVSPPARRGS